jgi:hypothetical protein
VIIPHDCRKLEVEDVELPQLILHRIVVRMGFVLMNPVICVTGTSSTQKVLSNSESVLMEKLKIDESAVKSFRLNFKLNALAMDLLGIKNIRKGGRANVGRLGSRPEKRSLKNLLYNFF